MPIVIIFFLCLLSALTGYFLKLRGVRTAYIWMVLVFISFMLWLALMVIPYERFSPLIFNDWFKFGETRISLRFALNPYNWILVLSMFSVNLSFFLTGIARLDIRSDLTRWIFQLVLIAFSFLALISADLWSIVLFWTILDLLELSFHRLILNDANDKIYFRRYIIKSLGSILLIWNIASLSSSGLNPLINGIVSSSPNTSIFLAAFIHSGIFPLDSESKKSVEIKSSDLLKNLFIVLNFFVSFSLISNLQAPELPFILSFAISIGSYILIIFSSIQWALQKDNNYSLHFLLLYEAGVFIFLYFSGAAQYITFLLVILTISILWLLFFTHRSKSLVIFPVISTFFVTGLPLSITAFGSRGFVGNGISVGLIVFLSSQILLIYGYIKRAYAQNEKFYELEIWYQVAYLIGLFLPFLSAAAIIFFSKTTMPIEFQYWWIGLIVVLLAVIGYFFSGKLFFRKNSEEFMPQTRSIIILRFLSFEWLFNSFTFLESKVWGFVNGFSGLMEGEGGIMWALVFLILIFSLLT